MNLSVGMDKVTVQPVVFFEKQPVAVDILRLDKIHPVVAGNKWFKLKGWLELAGKTGAAGLFTVGGAFSNHLVATAFASRKAGLPSMALVRGEAGEKDSPTLTEAREYGMEIHFVSREKYRSWKADPVYSGWLPPDWLFIPEGGAGREGVTGAGGIMDLIPQPEQYSHIICAVGTGTMLAGLINTSLPHQNLIGISSLKGKDTLTDTVKSWLLPTAARFRILFDFHMGGYAKHPPDLLQFMNQLYETTGIPTDIVYTGKLMFGIRKLVDQNNFSGSDRILAIHSGGIQGNRSLNSGQLCF